MTTLLQLGVHLCEFVIIRSNVANHAWMNDHQINFKNARVIDKGDYRVRKTLESWHTAMTTEADNNARSLPRQYSFKIVLFIYQIIFLATFLRIFIL